MAMIDVRNTVDLGTASHIIGNIMWDRAMAHVFGDRAQQENVERLMTIIQ